MRSTGSACRKRCRLARGASIRPASRTSARRPYGGRRGASQIAANEADSLGSTPSGEMQGLTVPCCAPRLRGNLFRTRPVGAVGGADGTEPTIPSRPGSLKFDALAIRKGRKKSVVALAHKLLRTFYARLASGTHDQDKEVGCEALNVHRTAPRWIKMLKETRLHRDARRRLRLASWLTLWTRPAAGQTALRLDTGVFHIKADRLKACGLNLLMDSHSRRIHGRHAHGDTPARG